MTYAEIKDMVMFQTNNDSEDLGDYMPYVGAYVNEGYDMSTQAYENEHVVDAGDYPPLAEDSDVPLTPAWTHRAIADWATWCVYRNGNPQKQQRGYVFREAAEGIFKQIRSAGGKTGLTTRITAFSNVPD